MLGWMAWLGSAVAASPDALRLTAKTQSADAWPMLRVLDDPDLRLDAVAALASMDRFEPPSTPYGNLGQHRGAVWLHVPLVIEQDAPSSWTLRVANSLLHDVQVRVFDARGQLIHQSQIGALIPFAEREQKTRALTTLLSLPSRQRLDLLVRVQSPTALVLPMALLQPGALGVEESREQALQGMMSGLWLFMILYCLANWVHRRQGLFLAYAAVLVSSWLFAQAVYGTGAQYLWPNGSWLSAHLAALAPLMMVSANAGFFHASLDMRTHAPSLARAMMIVSVLAMTVALVFIANLVPHRAATGAGLGLMLTQLALAMPVMVRRLRAGDRATAYLLVGSGVYLGGIVQMLVVVQGWAPFSFANAHGALFCFAGEMVCWLLVLSARLEQLRKSANEARREHDTLRLLAHTDPLTGLRNRRGLEASLVAEPPVARKHSLTHRLAIYVLDLDGFKPVNDRWGHDVGDALLNQVAKRLARAVRPTDIVARLGGDEFVVAVGDFDDERQAEQIGHKLLAQFEQAFTLGEAREVQLGASIGFALGRWPVIDFAQLLQSADTAMYAAKKSGKNCLVAADNLQQPAAQRIRPVAEAGPSITPP